MIELQPMEGQAAQDTRASELIEHLVKLEEMASADTHERRQVLRTHRMLRRAVERAESLEPMRSHYYPALEEPRTLETLQALPITRRIILIEGPNFDDLREQRERIERSLRIPHMATHASDPLEVTVSHIKVRTPTERVAPEWVLFGRPAPGSFVAFDEETFTSLSAAQQREIELVYGSVCGFPILLCHPEDPQGPGALITPRIDPSSPLLPLMIKIMQGHRSANYNEAGELIQLHKIEHRTSEDVRQMKQELAQREAQNKADWAKIREARQQAIEDAEKAGEAEEDDEAPANLGTP